MLTNTPVTYDPKFQVGAFSVIVKSSRAFVSSSNHYNAAVTGGTLAMGILWSEGFLFCFCLEGHNFNLNVEAVSKAINQYRPF